MNTLAARQCLQRPAAQTITRVTLEQHHKPFTPPSVVMTTPSVNPYSPPPINEESSSSSAYAPASLAQTAQLATRSDRLSAVILDVAILLAIMFVFSMVIELLPIQAGSFKSDTREIALTTLVILTFFLINLHGLATLGQTLGKRAFGIQICDHESHRLAGFYRVVVCRYGFLGLILAFSAAFQEQFGSILSWLLFVDILFIFGPQKRCLHDRIAQTKVVRCHSKRATL